MHKRLSNQRGPPNLSRTKPNELNIENIRTELEPNQNCDNCKEPEPNSDKVHSFPSLVNMWINIRYTYSC